MEWINDSCCNVLFADQQAAKRAVFGMGKPLPPEDIPEGQSASMPCPRRSPVKGSATVLRTALRSVFRPSEV